MAMKTPTRTALGAAAVLAGALSVASAEPHGPHGSASEPPAPEPMYTAALAPDGAETAVLAPDTLASASPADVLVAALPGRGRAHPAHPRGAGRRSRAGRARSGAVPRPAPFEGQHHRMRELS